MTKVKADGSVEAPPRRGRPPRLSRERIIQTALELGPERATLKTVAERLGVHPTALNRYVGDRAGLDGEVAAMLVEFNLSRSLPADATDWRALLRAFAGELRRVLLESSPTGLMERLPSATGAGPLEQLDLLCGRLQAADPAFDAILAAKAIAFVGQVVYVSVRDELLIRQHGRHPMDRALAGGVAAAGEDRLPDLRSYVGAREQIDPEAQFRFNLDCVIGGIEAALRS